MIFSSVLNTISVAPALSLTLCDIEVQMLTIINIYPGISPRIPTHYTVSSKFSDTQNVCCNHLMIQIKRSFCVEICPKDVDGMASNVNPDQIAPLGAV